MRNSSIVHQRYKEECAAFYDVANVGSKNEENHKSVLTWIEKAMNDVSLNVHCESEDTTVVGGAGSCMEIIQDSVVSHCKGRAHSQRKQKQFKKPKQKRDNTSLSTTAEVNLSNSFLINSTQINVI